MSVKLGQEMFPDAVLTAPTREVMTLFAARAASSSLTNRTAKQLIADWSAELERLRKRGART